MKRCSKCGLDKDESLFATEKARKDGLNPWCKQCRREHKQAAYYRRKSQSIPDAIVTEKWCFDCGETKPADEFYKACGMRDGLSGRCRICEKRQASEWKKLNPGRNRRNAKSWADKNKEKSREIARKSYWRHPENRRANSIKWQKEINPMQARINFARRRARLIQADAGFSKDDWEEVVQLFDGKCAYCGDNQKKLMLDHFIPLNRGGLHRHGNVVPACMFHNQSKKDRPPEDWVIRKFGQDKYDHIRATLESLSRNKEEA